MGATWTRVSARCTFRIDTHMSNSFENLRVYALGVELVAMVYESTQPFPKDELFGLTSQMRRSSNSIISNIAEGEGRLTNGEWRQFLGHARGSLFELESHCIIALRLGFLSTDDHEKLRRQIKRTAVALNNFIAFVTNTKTAPASPTG